MLEKIVIFQFALELLPTMKLFVPTRMVNVSPLIIATVQLVTLVINVNFSFVEVKTHQILLFVLDMVHVTLQTIVNVMKLTPGNSVN
jgi:hypothetical protein